MDYLELKGIFPFIHPMDIFLKDGFLKNKLFIYLGCAGPSLLRGLSLVVVSRGYSLVVMCGLLIVVASLVVEHGL